MRCSACGGANRDQSRSCGRCGASLGSGAADPVLPGALGSSGAVRRAAIANAATAVGARIDALVAAEDGGAIEALFAERAMIVDRRTGRRSGREERIAGLRARLASAREPESQHEPLAALGPSLAL